MSRRIAIAAFAVSVLWTSVLFGQVEVEVNQTAKLDDDYIGWTPVKCRIRNVGAAAATNVTLTSSKRQVATANQGEVVFLRGSANPTWTNFTPVDSLDVALPAGNGWAEFWIAGSKHSAGETLPDGTVVQDGKDVQIIVKQGGAELTRHALMVRVRKNAEELTETERDRYLSAVAELHDMNRIGTTGHLSKYLKYVKAHGDAFRMGIHDPAPVFAAWHRILLLSYERELQSIDARVALPYWKFDEPAPKLFSEDFMGRVGGGSNFVRFNRSNPLNGWQMPSNFALGRWSFGTPHPRCTEALIRNRNASSATSLPRTNLTVVLNQSNYALMNDRLEIVYHNSAHSHIGGWLVDTTSPKDPLFFMLHANTDRAWLLWQRKESAFDENNPLHYAPQGGYAPGSFHQSSFADDGMWPWGFPGGNQGNTDTGDDWPEIEFDLPTGFAGTGPSADPITKESVDFMNLLGTGKSHNASYDEVPYKK